MYALCQHTVIQGNFIYCNSFFKMKNAALSFEQHSNSSYDNEALMKWSHCPRYEVNSSLAVNLSTIECPVLTSEAFSVEYLTCDKCSHCGETLKVSGNFLSFTAAYK